MGCTAKQSISAIADSLKEAKAKAPEVINYKDCIIRFQDCLNALEDNNVSIEVKNALLKACISKIVYHSVNSNPEYSGRTKNPFNLEVFFKL